MQLFWMLTGISFTVSSGDHERLERIIGDPKSPQKHVWRARIIVASGDGLGTNAIMATTGKSKTCVWRWQKRYMDEGVDGLLHDKTRPPGTPPIAPHRVEEIVALTLKPPPHEATHWTLRAMLKFPVLQLQQCKRSGKRMALHRTGFASSNCLMIRPLRQKCMISLGFMSLLQLMLWCCQSMRSRRYRRLIAPNRDCR